MNNVEIKLQSELDTVRREYSQLLKEYSILLKENIELQKDNQQLRKYANMTDVQKAIVSISNALPIKYGDFVKTEQEPEYTHGQLAKELKIDSMKLSNWKTGYNLIYPNNKLPEFIKGTRNKYTKENYLKTKEIYLQFNKDTK